MAFGGPYIGYGVQRVLDAQLRYTRSTLPVYLRMRNFTPPVNSLAAELGFGWTPSGDDKGTTDIEVMPPPAVAMVSTHNIGQSGGKLRFGARTFLFTQTFVTAMLERFNLPDGMTLWRNDALIGFVTDDKLFSIEDIKHRDLGGQTVAWMLTCNANDLK